MQINFRKMTPEDASAVEVVEKSCFDMPWSRQSFWQEVLMIKLIIYWL